MGPFPKSPRDLKPLPNEEAYCPVHIQQTQLDRQSCRESGRYNESASLRNKFSQHLLSHCRGGRQFTMTGSSLTIAVQPPTVIRVNTVLTPPLAVVLDADEEFLGNVSDLSKVFALATLLDEKGNLFEEALVGRLAESAHLHPREDIMGYFLFENLAIKSVGHFCIRITLMRMDSSGGSSGSSSEGVASIKQVDSRFINVKEGNIQAESPSKICDS